MGVETLANLAGKSLIETWIGLTATPDELMIAAIGASDEFSEAEEAASVGRVVLDTTALLTIVMLDLEDVVLEAFDSIYIAQQVADGLSNWRANRIVLGAPAGMIGTDESGHYMISHFDPHAEEQLMERASVFAQRLRESTGYSPDRHCSRSD